MSDTRSALVDDLIRRLRAAFDPCTIYLFGSRAIGAARNDSDFDVMVVVPSAEENHFDRYKRARTALRGFNAAVDVLVYTQDEWNASVPQQNSIARQVRETGRCLHAA